MVIGIIIDLTFKYCMQKIANLKFRDILLIQQHMTGR